jgi:hypothetical protein
MTGAVPAELLAGRLRLGLLVLAGAGVAGTAMELAFLRHWNGLEQLIPWAALAVLAAAVLLVAVRPSAGRVHLGRAAGATGSAAGLYGVWTHVVENYHAGPLDGIYGPRWDAMTALDRIWTAATGGVGPAPTLAPAALAQIGLCLLLATLGHPALRRPAPVRSEPHVPTAA